MQFVKLKFHEMFSYIEASNVDFCRKLEYLPGEREERERNVDEIYY